MELNWPRQFSERPYAWLAAALVLAAAIRLYLFWQYFCISSDGVLYIQAARDFYAGQISAGLASVYPPLYPLIIAALFPLFGDWEITGQILSVVAGVFVLIPLFALLRRIYGTNVAVVASFLAAMAPFLARYSAHVRTESPFIFLSTVALLLFHTGVKNCLWSRFFYGGLIAGLAYLMRPEGIGFLAIIPVVLVVEWWVRRTIGFRGVCIGSLLTLLGFLILAVPYAAHLAVDTGDLGAISRKTNIAIWYGFKDSGMLNDDDLAGILAPGAPGLVQFFLTHPFAYIKKIALDLPPSLGVYTEAIHYSYVPFLLLGVFHSLRRKVRENADLLLFVFVVFYIVGFAALYVNLRYAIQLVPASLGWVAVGILWCLHNINLSRRLSPKYIQATVAILAIAFIGGTLGKALRPIAPEKAHVRESGAYLKGLKNPEGLKVLVFDDRIAFYADAQPVLLSNLDERSVIQTLRGGGADYVATEIAPWQQRFPAIAKDPQNYGLVLEKEFRSSGKGKILLFKVSQV